MTFGRRFASAVDAEYAESYVDYEHLKRHIRECSRACCPSSDQTSTDEDEQSGQSGAGAEAAALGCCTCCDEDRFGEALQQQVLRLDGVVTGVLGRSIDQAEVERLVAFADINHTAIMKIIEKFQKKCHPSPKLQELEGCLPRHPFVQALQQLRPELGEGSPAVAAEQQPSGDAPGPVSGRAEDGAIAGLQPAEGPDAAAAAAGAEALVAARAVPGAAAARLRGHARGLLDSFVKYMLITSSAACLFAAVFLEGRPVLQHLLWALSAVLIAVFLLYTCGRAAAELGPLGARSRDAPAPRRCLWERATYDALRERGSEPAARRVPPAFSLHVVAVLAAEAAGEEEERAAPSVEHLEGAIVPEPVGTAIGRAFREPLADVDPCPCCMQDFSPEDPLAVLRCGHVFCEGCIEAWAAQPVPAGGRCPVCRVSFVVEDA